MMDSIDLDASPAAEMCIPAGLDSSAQHEECRIYRRFLERTFGTPPAGARFRIVCHDHDLGTYYAVEVRYDDDDETAADFAYHVEGNTPETWDAIARDELTQYLGVQWGVEVPPHATYPAHLRMTP